MSRIVAMARLWAYVGEGRLGGYPFQRRGRIHGIIAGMHCTRCSIIIDVVHTNCENGRGADDAHYSDVMLARHGYRVLRFSEQAVLQHIDVVCQEILQACRSRDTSRRAQNINAPTWYCR